MTNIRSIAKLAGVSVSTVSRVLNDHPYVKEEKRRKVLDAVERLNYIKNANAVHLSKGKTYSIGVILPYLNLPYFGEILQGIAGEALKHGYHLQLFQTNYDRGAELDAFHRLQMKEVDGLILTSRSNSLEVLAPFIGPNVVLCENVSEAKYKKVFINHYQGIRSGVEYLHSKGHSRIGLCLHRTFGTNSEERIRGFYDSSEAAAIHPVCEDWIFNDCYDLQDGRDVLDAWERLGDRPTALIVTSDQVSAGMVAEAGKKSIRIPKDLAILSFDNHPLADALGITSFEVPIRKLGEEAFKLFLQEEHPDPVILDTKLFERGTV
ncbi:MULTISPECIES: LacI family DNA-binding transcriptional regulator [Bacillaceae]|uniref:LacI family DNA-binding transcriptional regulator n=1 Tax=Bacillaceae TaxID=186817 RepID=UPI001C565F0B|nr:LacI family DNA-binding transcriptional regulator [Rossellomorea sp. YZS02]MBW3110792.1 LacI family DNA-binding transcriptional regulator [Bacillus sp. MCCB 382]MDX8343317.1 LacI family DNA-binding transcriptional regulator [Rossellomorea sp. YZS02]